MNLFQQVKRLAGGNTAAISTPEAGPLRTALESGQRAKWSEDYPAALAAFNQAMALAQAGRETAAITMTAYLLAEVYIRQGKWAEAETILQQGYQSGLDKGQKMQTAYMLIGMGALAQAQDNWAGAQAHYERAIQAAREGRIVGAEGRGMGLLADTYLHDANASYAVHLLREALPKLNMAGDVELSGYFVGRLGEALIAIGSETEGAQMLERGLRLARQIGYRLHERQWSVVSGKRALAEGRYADAYAHFIRALTLSENVPPSQQTVDILCQLSKACLSLRETAEALEHANRARALSAEIHEPRLSAAAYGAAGAALLAEKRATEALPLLAQAAAAYEGLAGDLAEIDLLRNLADAQAEAGDDAAAILTYKRAVERAEALDARLEVAQTRRDLGLLHARRGKMQEAVREWTAALAVYDPEKQPSQVARLLCDIAAGRKFLGQGQRAMKDCEQALMLLSSLNDDWETRGLVLSHAANTYVDQGDIESAEAFFNESIAIARRLGNEAAEATRRGNYGWFLLSMGRPHQAISALEYALRLSRSLKLDLQCAIQTDNLGLAYDSVSNYPKALEYHRRALDMVRSLHNLHWENAFKINLGNTLRVLGQTAEAVPLFQEAAAQGRTNDDIELIVRGLAGLARTLLDQGQAAEATAGLEEAANLARKADMRHALADILSVFSEQQAALGQPERAAALWDEAQKLFHMLHHPQAKMLPAWLHGQPAESKT